jgi:hypothetical protein
MREKQLKIPVIVNDEFEIIGKLKRFAKNNGVPENDINNKLPFNLTVSTNNKLFVDISGQRVITDISGQTLKVNTISGFSLDHVVELDKRQRAPTRE